MIKSTTDQIFFKTINSVSSLTWKTCKTIQQGSVLGPIGPPSHLTCILSPGGSPLGPAREVFEWGLFDFASGEASWEGAGQAVLGTASEGALLERQRVAQREERVRVCRWAEVE